MVVKIRQNISRPAHGQRSVSQPPGVVDPDAPTWETPTWADTAAFDSLYERGMIPMTAAKAAQDSGIISRSQYDYHASGLGQESQRSRFERMLGFRDHRSGFFGGLENFVGLLETISGYRFLVAASSAVMEGLKDPDSGLHVGGFGLAISTNEFKEAWHGRTHYSDVFAKGSEITVGGRPIVDPGRKGAPILSGAFASGLLADVLLDPATWLTFGVSSAARVAISAESKAAGILAKNAGSFGAKGSAKLTSGGAYSLTRHGQDIMKIAGRHYVKGGTRSKTLARVMSKRGVEVPEDLVGRISDFHGVARADIMPEHLAGMMKDPKFRTELTEFAVENYEAFALEHLDLMRGGAGRGAVAQTKSMLHMDKWRPEALASRGNLQRGPMSMFNETAGMFGKERGIPVDDLLGATAFSINKTRGRLTQAIMDDTVPVGLKTATKFVGFAGGVAEGAIDTTRKWFMSALERMPVEERIATQAIMDSGTHRMAQNAEMVKAFFNTPVRMTLADGTDVAHKMTREDKIAISMAIDNPGEYADDLADHLQPARDWVNQRFEDIFEMEDRFGVGGEQLSDYVTLIYGPKATQKIMEYMKELKVGGEKADSLIPVGKLNWKNPFAAHRAIATFDDAIEFYGKNMVELDIANILHRRYQVSGRMITKQSARSYMVSKYAIGGLGASLTLELAGHQKMMRLANYIANYIDTGPAVKSSPAQLKQIDLTLERLAHLDLDKMGKLSGEWGKRVKRGVPEEQAGFVPLGGNQVGKAGKRVVKEGEAYKQEEFFTTPGKAEAKTGQRPWFQDSPPPKKGISKKEAKDWLKANGFDNGGKFRKKDIAFAKRRIAQGGRHADQVKKNRQLISRVAKQGFGKNKLSDLTAGEMDFLNDFLNGFIKPGLMADRKGRVRGKLWKSRDELVLTKMVGGEIDSTRHAFREVDAGVDKHGPRKRLVAGKAEVRTIDDKTALGIIAKTDPDFVASVKQAEDIGKLAPKRAKKILAERDARVAAVKKEFTKAPSNVSLARMESKAIRQRLSALGDQVSGLKRQVRKIKLEFKAKDVKLYERHVRRLARFEKDLFKLEFRSNTVDRLVKNRLEVREKWLTKADEKLAKSTGQVDELTQRIAELTPRAKKTRAKLEDKLAKAQERLTKHKSLREQVQSDIDNIDDWRSSKAGTLDDDLAKLKKDIANEKIGRAKRAPAFDKSELAKRIRARAGEYEGQLNELKRGFKPPERGTVDGTYILPKSFVEAIDEMLDSGFKYNLMHHRMLKGWQNFQQYYKVSLTLPFSEHHARNFLTSVGLTYTRMGLRMLNPQTWAVGAHTIGYLLYQQQKSHFGFIKSRLPKAAHNAFSKLRKKADDHWKTAKVITETGVEYTYKEIADQALLRGLNQAFVFAEIGIPPFRRFDSVSNGVLVGGPKWVHDQVWDVVRETSHASEIAFDIPFRIGMFTDEVLRGSSFDEAAEVVRTHLNDWSRLSGKEKVYMRTEMPFYSWFQFSIERFFKDALEQPGRFILPFKVTRNLERGLGGEPPEGYVPNFINERLGIWTGPNEMGYYSKLVGFGQNQEEAFRQMGSMNALARTIINASASTMHEGLGDVARELTGGAPHPDEAPLRFLSQMDFVTKSIVEGVYGRELFSGAPTGTRPELLMAERSRLEQGKGFSELDKGIAGSTGGKWLQDWLQYKETGSGRSEISARRRWILGQIPVSRFVAQYERHIKHKSPGEVNYMEWAASALGVNVYRYHPDEGRYYRDRARIAAVARLARQAHLIKSGSKYWDQPEDPDPVTVEVWERIKEERRAATEKDESGL